MAKQLRIGIAGCGKIAQRSHAPGFTGVPGVRITALCDISSKNMETIRREHAPEAECFTDYASMLAGASIDAVSICSPNKLHAPMTLAALRKGLHVLCEKPIAGTVPEATRMVNAARKAGLVLQINQSIRYLAIYQTVADLVHKGRIGDPLHIRCIRAGGATPDKSWAPGSTWFVKKSEQGGLILDIGIHMADMMSWIAGPVDTVAAMVETRTPGIDVVDHFSAVFSFANKATGVLELSWALPVGAGLLEIYGSKGRIRLGFGDQDIELTVQQGKKSTVTYPALKRGVKDSYACFAAAIGGRMASPTPGELGRDALALCDAIARSGERRQFVKVKRFQPN